MLSREPDLPPQALRWTLTIWPAFLAACLLEALVFSMIDPGDVRSFGLGSSSGHKGTYTLAFFGFLLICSACSALVLWLARPPVELNDSAAAD